MINLKNKNRLRIAVLYSIFFVLISKLNYSQIKFGIEQEVLTYPLLSIFSNNPFQKEIILQGGGNMQNKKDKRIKLSGFLYYYLNQIKNIRNEFPYNGPLIPSKTYSNMKIKNFFLNGGIGLSFYNKRKNNSFNIDLGIGGGIQRNIGDGFLVNKKISWCISPEISYKFYLNKFYFKPFIGVLNCFTFRDFNYYNDGTIVDDNTLAFYSSTNQYKKNFYKKSKTTNGKDLIIDYQLLGLTNAYYLPSLMLSIGYTF